LAQPKPAPAPRRVFRIRRRSDDLWTLRLPDSVVDQGFPTAQAAILYARWEIRRSRVPAWIELWIGNMDFSGYFDPARPKAMFGVED
jgi:hypothetical protein